MVAFSNFVTLQKKMCIIPTISSASIRSRTFSGCQQKEIENYTVSMINYWWWHILANNNKNDLCIPKVCPPPPPLKIKDNRLLIFILIYYLNSEKSFDFSVFAHAIKYGECFEVHFCVNLIKFNLNKKKLSIQWSKYSFFILVLVLIFTELLNKFTTLRNWSITLMLKS